MPKTLSMDDRPSCEGGAFAAERCREVYGVGEFGGTDPRAPPGDGKRGAEGGSG